MSTTTAAPATNAITLPQLKQIAFDLGTDAGKGKDTQIKFGLKLVEAAYMGAIDLDRNKHGTDVDDATLLSGEYFKGQSGSTVFDAKAPNQRKLIACSRTLVRLGSWPKGGNGEPLATVNSLMTHRQKLRQDPTQAKKLDDAFNTLMRYARQQIRRDQLIDDSEFKDFCFRKQGDPATVEEVWDDIRKKALNLKAGKAGNGTAQDKGPEINQVIDICNKRMSAFAAAKAKTKPGGKAA